MTIARSNLKELANSKCIFDRYYYAVTKVLAGEEYLQKELPEQTRAEGEKYFLEILATIPALTLEIQKKLGRKLTERELLTGDIHIDIA